MFNRNDIPDMIDIKFAASIDTTNIIKVVGVGGGGGNAVAHMFHEGVSDVSFLLCNTDKQALDAQKINVPKLVMGGLGAGGKPEKGEEEALKCEEQIKQAFNDGTQMAFITAGMGGGTGTGAGPVVARIAKDAGVLTVGIVTIPFVFEGRPKILQALQWLEKMNRNVDAMLVINNERLFDIYKSLKVTEAFAEADNTLTVAARSIVDMIMKPGKINLDFRDVESTLKNGGVALMSEGLGEGEGRLELAIEEAFKSPLLNNSNVYNAKKILFNITSGTGDDELTADELADVQSFSERFNTNQIEVIWGFRLDESLGAKVKFTVLATGYQLDEDAPEGMKIPDDNTELTAAEMEAYKDYLFRKYYGDKGISRPAPTIAILTPEEMENDVLVSLIENNPTYKRNPSLIKNERSKIEFERKNAEAETAVLFN